MVGISQQAVSGLVQRGVLLDGDSLAQWLLAYCDHLREMAAGRATGDEGINLATERALLAREQRERIAMQNAERRRELAPAHLLEQVLSRAGARAAKILDTIPGEVKRRMPQLGADDVTLIATIVAKARNIAAGMSLGDLDVDDEDAGDATTDAILGGAA